MSAPLRVGVIGSGWAGGLHAAAFHTHPDTTVTALLARTTSTAERLAGTVGDPKVFTDLDAFLGSGIDIVSIATPPDSHAAFTNAACARGLHLLCDKPVALTGDDARAMLDAADRAGVRHATGFIWRGDPGLARLRQLIGAGEIGEVRDLHVRCALGAPVLPMTWMYEESAGGGALMQHGGHIIDRARWLLDDEIVEVTGELLRDVEEAEVGPRFHHVQEAFGWAGRRLADPDREPLPTAKVTADTGYRFSAVFAGGVRGHFFEAWHSCGPAPDHVEVQGSTGTLVWSGAHGVSLVRPRQAPRPIPVEGSTEAGSGDLKDLDAVGRRLWSELVAAFVADIRGESAPGYPTLVDGWRVQTVIDAVRASGAARTPVAGTPKGAIR